MPFEIETAIVGAVSGLASASIISLLSPLISQRIKNTETKKEARKETIQSIIAMIKSQKTLQSIGESYEYQRIETYLCEELISYMHPISQNKEGTVIVSIPKNSNNIYVMNLLEKELARLEKEWGII
jgi:hypothetical protein